MRTVNGQIIIIILLVIFVYAFSLTGPFVFDDFHVFVHNDDFKITNLDFISIKKMLASSTTGISSRPVALITLAFNSYFFGLEPFSFKLVNLCIHLVNTCLLFAVLEKLFFLGDCSKKTSKYAVVVITAIWALHPLNLTSVLYVVQRMASLAATFMLLMLICFLKMREKQIYSTDKAWRYLIPIIFLFVLAVLTKENSVIILGIFFIIEVLLFKKMAQELSVKNLLSHGVKVGWLFLAVLFAVLMWKWQWLQDSYQERGYTLEERLLTETRVLWFYIKLILIPNVMQMSLYHDDFTISKSIFQPITTFWAIFAWLLVSLWIFLKRKKYPLIALGVLWYLIGHAVESSIIGLELVHEHRNYFPMIGIWIAAAGIVIVLNEKFLQLNKLSWLVYVFIGLLCTGTWGRAQHWNDWPSLAESEVLKNQNSPRAQLEAARWYFQVLNTEKNPTINTYGFEQAKYHLISAYQVDKNDLSGLLSLFKLVELVRIPPEQIWVDELLKRLEYVKIERENMKRLDEFMQCNIDKICHADLAIINKMLFALEKNKSLIPIYKAKFYYYLGALLLEKGSSDLALYYYSLAQETDNNNQSFAINLALVFLQMDNYVEAMSYYKTIQKNLVVKEWLKNYEDLSKKILEYQITATVKKILPQTQPS
jgi:hypothetical protein